MQKQILNKKNLIRIKEICIFAILIIFCALINIKYDILALFIDDLNSFTYFPNMNIFEYAFKFYDGMIHYRPFYEFFQYIAFFIAGHNPHILFIINIIFNSFIAFCIYIVIKDMTNSNVLPMTGSFIYLISHFSCYQINQATGLMESIATFLAIYIFNNCFKLVINESNKNIIKIVIAYFCIILTHERYIILIGIILFSIILVFIKTDNNDKNKKQYKKKEMIIGVFLIFSVLFLVIVLRYFAIGKLIPAGTSGTRVEETFKVSEFIDYIKKQIQFIFGFNCGEESSCGITYDMLKKSTKMIINLQVVFILIYIVLYIVLKITKIFSELKNVSEAEKVKNIILYFKEDMLFLVFIFSCILVSSITVMLEIRFIYVSFVIFVIYLIYIFNYIKQEYYIKKVGIYLVASIILFLSLFMRVAVEFRYRDGNDNIYYMIDQRRLNSLAKETVCKYGNNIIDDKKIYVLNNSFLYTKRYAQYLFQIYQKDYEIREIEFINNIDDLDKLGVNKKDIIVLAEDKKNDRYYEVNIEYE